MTGGHRGVRGEDALAAHVLDISLSGGAQRAAAKLALKQGQRKQRGVAFVHVIDVYTHSESIGHAHAAHAEHNFLLHAIVFVAAVKMVGKAAVPAGIELKVGIEQVNGNDVAKAALDVVAPGTHGDDAIFDKNCNASRLFCAEIGGVPGLHGLGLLSAGGEMLLKVPFAVQQGECSQGNAHICRRAQGIAGQHAEAAGVSGHRRIDGDFHGEVSYVSCVGKNLV